MKKPNIGDPVRFVPAGFSGFEITDQRSPLWMDNAVTSRVIYINEKHRFCTVEFEVHGVKLRESIKFEP